MAVKRQILTVRYESKGQLNKFKQAAALARWSLNTFLLAAGDAMAEQILSKPATTNEPKDRASDSI